MKTFMIAIDRFTEEQQNNLKCGVDYEPDTYINNEPYYAIYTVAQAKANYNFEQLQDVEPTEDYCILIEWDYPQYSLIIDENEINRLLELNEMTEEEYYDAYVEDDEYQETVNMAYNRAIMGY